MNFIGRAASSVLGLPFPAFVINYICLWRILSSYFVVHGYGEGVRVYLEWGRERQIVGEPLHFTGLFFTEEMPILSINLPCLLNIQMDKIPKDPAV